MIRDWIILIVPAREFHLAVITREFQLINFVESGLWISLGIGTAFWSRRVFGPARSDLLILALDLVAFGLSDLVEAHTGAWWKPLWLLVWKGTCLLVMLVLLARYIRRRYRS